MASETRDVVFLLQALERAGCKIPFSLPTFAAFRNGEDGEDGEGVGEEPIDLVCPFCSQTPVPILPDETMDAGRSAEEPEPNGQVYKSDDGTWLFVCYNGDDGNGCRWNPPSLPRGKSNGNESVMLYTGTSGTGWGAKEEEDVATLLLTEAGVIVPSPSTLKETSASSVAASTGDANDVLAFENHCSPTSVERVVRVLWGCPVSPFLQFVPAPPLSLVAGTGPLFPLPPHRDGDWFEYNGQAYQQIPEARVRTKVLTWLAALALVHGSPTNFDSREDEVVSIRNDAERLVCELKTLW